MAAIFLRGQTNKFLFPFIFVWSGPKKMNASRSAILLSSLILCGVSEGLDFVHRCADAPQKRRKKELPLFFLYLYGLTHQLVTASQRLNVGQASTRKRKGKEVPYAFIFFFSLAVVRDRNEMTGTAKKKQ